MTHTLSAKLSANSYGKSRVRLTKVIRQGDRHEVLEMSVDITLEGDFEASYTQGDNRSVVATDSMKNTVYVLARETEFDCIDAFAAVLANHFVKTYAQVSAAEIKIGQTMFDRVPQGADVHDHAFVGGRQDQRTCRVRAESGGALRIFGGVAGLVVLKSAGSEFVDFVTDRFRTLPDTTERIFATTIDAEWSVADLEAHATETYDLARSALVSCFADHHSLAVQQTLLEMGKAALGAAPAIERIDLSMPNQHRVPFNLEPFGLDNPAMIFVPTDEPAGQIRGTVERS
ncbi:MAG: factor-independent urate hydroxylase [Planctomycetota bacterium]